MKAPRITLEQWRCLVAVVDAGGYAQAAERLDKSQSSVTYAVQRISTLLDTRVFERRGRRSVLTSAGAVLVRRGRRLLEQSERLERLAASLAGGQEPEIRVAAEIIFPTWMLLEALREFGSEFPDIRVELYESVLGGTEELLISGAADVAIASRIPAGFAGDPLLAVRFVCCSAPDHPLARAAEPLTLDDLARHRHLVVRDSGTVRSRRVLALDAEQRWTVSHKATSIRAACMGLGFAWFAESNIRGELHRGELVPLALAGGGVRLAHLYLVEAEADAAGPGRRRLVDALRQAATRNRRDGRVGERQ